MLEFLKANTRQILFMFRLLLIVFGVLASIPVFLTFTDIGYIVVLYAGSFALGISFFCTLLIVFLGLIENLREEKFFGTKPFGLIREKSTKIEYVFQSKYFFSKKHYSFSLDGDTYEAVFYSDVVKTIYGDTLVIKKNPGTDEVTEHWIEYKKQTFDEKSLINELKKITPDENRFILRNV
jgi:hypothetical protein